MFIGAGKLSRENLPKDRIEILDNIHYVINALREEAKKVDLEEEKKHISKSKPTNFISILGERGSGKTSVALTVLEEIKNNNNCDECGALIQKNNAKDTILNIIDPTMFNVEKNALGWILYLFKEKLRELEKKFKTQGYCGDEQNIKNLEEIYDRLKITYIQSRPFYREKLAVLSEGIHEYNKVNENIMCSEIELSDLFRQFINKYIETIKHIQNRENKKEDKKEALIFITFDDIDLSPQYGTEILDTILNYLKHPNIIVFTLGSYNTFRETLMIDLWNKEKIPNQFDKETVVNQYDIFDDISIRADDILGKSLPPQFRYYLNELDLKDRLRFTPYGKGNIEKNNSEVHKNEEQKKLFEFFKVAKKENQDKQFIEIIKKDKDNNKFYYSMIEWFIEPIINVDVLYEKINKLEEKERKYDGFEIDKAFLETYKDKMQGYSTEIENNEVYRKIWSYLNTKGEQLKNNCDNENNNELQYVYEIAPYSHILGETPRSLINLYNLIKNNDKLKLDYFNKIDMPTSNKASFKGYGKLDVQFMNNFENIHKLYQIIKNTNLEINYNRNKFKMEDLVKFDTETKQVYFDFEKLKFEGNKIYKYVNHNVSQELLKIKYEYELKSIELNNAQSSFIQFFYDLCQIFLDENYIVVRGKIDLSDIPVYKREEDSIEITMINFKCFKHYYIFQKLHELCLPIILEDRQVHRNIRDRLKIFFVNALNYLRQISYNQFNNTFIWLCESFKDDRGKKLLLSIATRNYYEKDYEEKFNEEYNKMHIINFIRFYREIENPYENKFEWYINNDNITKIYNKLIEYITNTLAIEQRFSKIEKIFIDSNKYIKEKIEKNKQIKNLKESLESGEWTKVRLNLFSINCVYIAKIIKAIYYNRFLENDKEKIIQIIEIMKIFSNEKEKIIKKTSKKNIDKYEELYEEIEFLQQEVIEGINESRTYGIVKLEEYIKRNEEIHFKTDEKIEDVLQLDQNDNNIEILGVYRELSKMTLQKSNKKHREELKKIICNINTDDMLLNQLKQSLEEGDTRKIKKIHLEIVEKYAEALIKENKKEDLEAIIKREEENKNNELVENIKSKLDAMDNSEKEQDEGEIK